MHDLIVVRFPDKNAASSALEDCLQLAYDGDIDLFDAVAVHWTEDGRLRIDGSVQPTRREQATWGAVFAGFLGAILAGAFTAGLGFAPAIAATAIGGASAGAVGAEIGAHDAEKARDLHGLPEDFIRNVAGMIQSGDSALFALFETRHADRALMMFRTHGGTILQTTVGPARTEGLQHALDTLDA
jgi:uncharacterized membrane protein